MILHDYRLDRADAKSVNSTLLPWVVIGVTFLTVAMAFGAIISAIALFIGAGAGIGPWLGGAGGNSRKSAKRIVDRRGLAW